MTTEPLTPYAGTSGWSGSHTSRERAEREDTDGTTSERQQRTLHLLGRTTATVTGEAGGREAGLTVADLRARTGWHHGQASGALSVLHKEGRIARLAERRDRCAVYVLPEYVNGRETKPHGRNKAPSLTDEERQAVASVTSRLFVAEEIGTTFATVPTRDVRTVLDAIGRLTDG